MSNQGRRHHGSEAAVGRPGMQAFGEQGGFAHHVVELDVCTGQEGAGAFAIGRGEADGHALAVEDAEMGGIAPERVGT